MTKNKNIRSFMPAEVIENKILMIRGHKVMLDADLAALYGVKTFNLNKAVKRNASRFPIDFMFQLTKEETNSLRFHIGISKPGRGGRRYPPHVFTEQGVAMLSSVLKSERAAQVNVAVMRAFVRIRQILSSNKSLSRRLDELESKYDTQFKAVFDAIRELMSPPVKPRKCIGFTAKETRAKYSDCCAWRELSCVSP